MEEIPSRRHCRHGEAYCLMAYRCTKCGKEEVIWNSRDGVTPFIIGCRWCGGEAQHVRWEADAYAPCHRAAPGKRIFVDMTPEKARLYANRRFDRAKGTPYELPESEREEFIARCLDGRQPGEPDLVVVGEEK